MEALRDKVALRQLQALPLDAKITMAEQRIMEWYRHFNGDVVISFSGGKDSTVLAHLVHGIYPDVPMVFANTGLEYPEIQAFARKMGAEFVRPKMSFSEVITKYGYPIISKENAEAIYFARRLKNVGGWGDVQEEPVSDYAEHPQSKRNKLLCGIREDRMWVNWRRQPIAGVGDFSEQKKSIYNKSKWLPLCRDTQFQISHMCCNVMKKGPMHSYQRKTKLYPFVGTLAEESKLREQAWIQHGCNAYEGTRQISAPLSLWTEQDVLHYIKREGLEIASVYGDIVEVDDSGYEYFDNLLGEQCTLRCTGCDRTGCIFCGYGAHLEKQHEKRFVRLAKTHPRQYEYCMRGGQWVDNPAYDPAAPKMDGDWENWNPKKIWVPSKEGLGMKYVFDEVNKIYGKDFIRYE